MFGVSISGGVDVDQNKYPGNLCSVYFLKTDSLRTVPHNWLFGTSVPLPARKYEALTMIIVPDFQ